MQYTSFERTQSSTWIEDYDLREVFKLSKRLNIMTGLQITSPFIESRENEIPISEFFPFIEAEPLQVNFIAGIEIFK